MTKERYKALTDKEKVEWLGIFDCEAGEAIRRFVDKLESIGISYRYTGDMLDEFMWLEDVAKEKDKIRILNKEHVNDAKQKIINRER